MAEFYWVRNPGGPFATLIRIATTYLHPEADDLESLQRLAQRENDTEMRVFKAELLAALQDPARLPDDELSKHVRYEDGSPEAFLRRLWEQLYLEEARPPARPGSGVPAAGYWRAPGPGAASR